MGICHWMGIPRKGNVTSQDIPLGSCFHEATAFVSLTYATNTARQ